MMSKQCDKCQQNYFTLELLGRAAAVGVLSLLLVSLASGQWEEPQRIAMLSTEADECAPAWSPVDSTLYFVRIADGRAIVLALRWCRPTELMAARTVQLDTVRDSVLYASFSRTRWVGHRLVKGKRQWQTQLVQSTQQRPTAVEPIALDGANEDGTFALFPALSADGTQLVFAVTDGAGEATDLWMSNWREHRWSRPFVLSGFEQSAESEITPCFLGNDTLIFASNGFGGRGGFDLFMSVRHAGVWMPPMPLAALNSAADDRDPCVLPNGDLIFVSNRAGSFDLYYARKTQSPSK